MNNLFLILVLLSASSLPAQAQSRATGLAQPIPCKLKIDAQFSKSGDDRTVEALAAALDALRPSMPHVQPGFVFPRSGSNIKWVITLSETSYEYTQEDGHVVRAKVSYRFEGAQNNVAEYSTWGESRVSYEAAAAQIVQRVVSPQLYEERAVALGCPASYGSPSREPSSVDASNVTKIRVMTANISTGNRQSYTDGEGIRIFQGLKPDVVMIQEFNYKSNTIDDLAEMIETAFAKGFAFYRESELTDKIPNGIISRFPFVKIGEDVQAGEWTDNSMPDRDFAWARIDIPGDRDLWAISVHLSSSKPVKRKQEATDLRNLIESKIPAQDYVVLGGDFNIAGRDDVTVRILNGRDENNVQTESLKNALFEKAAPTDALGRTTTNRNHNKNYDWVLADSDLNQYQVATRLKMSEAEAEVEGDNLFPNGLVFDSRTFKRLDRVPPVRQTDSEATNMQHMAVIKDYEVPNKRSIQKSKKPLAKRHQ